MELLTDEKSRYAAAILVNGYHSNVESAFKEAEAMLNGKWNPLTLDDNYYLLYNPESYRPYVVKIQSGDFPNPEKDRNALRLKW